MISKDRKESIDKMAKSIPTKQKFGSYGNGKIGIFDKINKGKSKREIKNFRQGLNFNNFAEKTNIYFKNRLVNHEEDFDKSEDKLIPLDPEIWRNKLTEVFKELKGENIY